jgi:hypothetical protein
MYEKYRRRKKEKKDKKIQKPRKKFYSMFIPVLFRKPPFYKI